MRNLFDNKNLLLFEPYDGVEFIYSILQNIGHYPDFSSIQARKEGLITINQLLELDLIEIFHWGKYENNLKDKDLTVSEKMIYIQELWFKGATFEDFHNMPIFKYKKWYIENLEKLGMNHYKDWKEFVKTKIGNLEKWIIENRLKQ